MLEGLDGVQQIQDDVVIHGAGKQHDQRLQAVLERLQTTGMTLRKEKCHFGVPEMLWFGNTFSKQGMSPDPEKVKMISAWPAPADKAEVKSFLQTIAQKHQMPETMEEAWRPVNHTSRALTPAEQIMTNLRYLYGTKFVVVVDHEPLVCPCHLQ